MPPNPPNEYSHIDPTDLLIPAKGIVRHLFAGNKQDPPKKTGKNQNNTAGAHGSGQGQSGKNPTSTNNPASSNSTGSSGNSDSPTSKNKLDTNASNAPKGGQDKGSQNPTGTPQTTSEGQELKDKTNEQLRQDLKNSQEKLDNTTKQGLENERILQTKLKELQEKLKKQNGDNDDLPDSKKIKSLQKDLEDIKTSIQKGKTNAQDLGNGLNSLGAMAQPLNSLGSGLGNAGAGIPSALGSLGSLGSGAIPPPAPFPANPNGTDASLTVPPPDDTKTKPDPKPPLTEINNPKNPPQPPPVNNQNTTQKNPDQTTHPTHPNPHQHHVDRADTIVKHGKETVDCHNKDIATAVRKSFTLKNIDDQAAEAYKDLAEPNEDGTWGEPIDTSNVQAGDVAAVGDKTYLVFKDGELIDNGKTISIDKIIDDASDFKGFYRPKLKHLTTT